MLYGASPIAQAVLERAMKAFPNASFTQAYGMTELFPVATLLSPDDHRRTDLLRAAGRAAPHSEVRGVDDGDREVPRGTVGEIVARGGHVMLGYWNQPEATAAAVRDGWMHTGDGGFMDDRGYVHVVDRLKDMTVIGGENVYSARLPAPPTSSTRCRCRPRARCSSGSCGQRTGRPGTARSTDGLGSVGGLHSGGVTVRGRRVCRPRLPASSWTCE